MLNVVMLSVDAKYCLYIAVLSIVMLNLADMRVVLEKFKSADHDNKLNNTQHNDIQHYGIQHKNIQHNNNQHNDIQPNNTQQNDDQHSNIQHNNKQNATISIMTLSIMSERCYVEYYLGFLSFMLSVTNKF
jgi:hypothetical protein